MENFWDFLSGFFREDNGNPSMARLVTFGTVCVILFNWTYVVITSGGKVSVGAQEITLLALAMGHKIASKLTEQKG